MMFHSYIKLQYMMKMKRSYLLSILSKEITGLLSIVYEQLQLGLLQRWKGHKESDKCSLKSITARKILTRSWHISPPFSQPFFLFNSAVGISYPNLKILQHWEKNLKIPPKSDFSMWQKVFHLPLQNSGIQEYPKVCIPF